MTTITATEHVKVTVSHDGIISGYSTTADYSGDRHDERFAEVVMWLRDEMHIHMRVGRPWEVGVPHYRARVSISRHMREERYDLHLNAHDLDSIKMALRLSCFREVRRDAAEDMTAVRA